MRIKKNYLAYLLRTPSWKRKAKMAEWILRNKELWGPHPIYAKIEIDQRCNLKCPKCYRNEVVNNKFLTREKFNEVLDKLGPGLCEVWTHGFGEPTMHPQFLDLMQDVVDRGMLWGLATNGATPFFRSEKDWKTGVDNIKRMFMLNPQKIRFSIDAADKETFEKERYPAKYETVMSNINMCTVCRDRWEHISGNYVRVDLYCVLTMQTLDQIGPMIDLRDKLDCDWITFSDLAWNNDFGTSIENNAVRQMMSPEEIEELIAPYKNRPRVKFNIPRPVKRTCDYPKSHIYVDAEGWIYPCTCVPGKETPFGNIFDIKNIKKIYQSFEYDVFREQSKTGHIPSEECYRCLQWGPDYNNI